VANLAYATFLQAEFWGMQEAEFLVTERPLMGTILPVVDTTLALMMSWALAAQSFFLFNTKTFWDAPGLVGMSNWEVYVNFLANTIAEIVTAPPDFVPTHTSSRVLYMLMDVYHYFYLALTITVGAVSVFEYRNRVRKAEKKRKRSSSAKLIKNARPAIGAGTREMFEL
jgi:hypothetical protein